MKGMPRGTRSATAAFVLLSLSGTACGPGGPSPEADPDSAVSSPALQASLTEAERTLVRLEELLVDADTLSLTYDVRSTGAFEARLSGQLLREAPTAGIRAAGHFGDVTVNGAVVEEDGRLELTLGDSTASRTAPEATWEALAVGMTRMGVLHNLARLTEMEFPDHVEGGVRQWVRAGNVRMEEGDVPGGTNLVFDVVVDGEVSGEATLVLGSGGLPVERRQRVDFGDETMEVLERYTWIRVPVEPGTAETFSF